MVHLMQVCVDAKLWVLAVFLSVGMVGYAGLEIIQRKEDAREMAAAAEVEAEVTTKKG